MPVILDWTTYDSLFSDNQTRYQPKKLADELRQRVTSNSAWTIRINTPDLFFATISITTALRKNDRWIVIARRTLVE